MRQAMDLEGVKRWLPGDRDGYESLAAAMGAGPPAVTVARRLDAEQLELGGGLEVLLAAALEGVAAGRAPRGRSRRRGRSRSSCPAGRARAGTSGRRERAAGAP